ncbi:hypothetical protein TREMEDRAFT_69291 [Tremella mesenterica DSM 1558]|uniref:uncharacterized protein n=1 Tax=Tremella mesenterica (strain ATCC 24925 / CBS 8224 / DSM 1558 / NBRC 9311 / NRRL Y-6157 / RJB 2259-6 / UBC 559-6) TaxID=578456 RepID=UPI0003F49102|nr:uncharacterized protein TREMEDRAFT_69291 [Tremella mesenterica DSM 1558]EIW68283.1 hypothetical protein TREMEDRAFT_69291 [Tremella mesenterica DSM 1558]
MSHVTPSGLPLPRLCPLRPHSPETPLDETDSHHDHHHSSFVHASHDLQPFTPVWANSKWKALTQGRPLLKCLPLQSAKDLGAWLTSNHNDRLSSSTNRFSSSTPTGYPTPLPNTSITVNPATGLTEKLPPVFWEPDNHSRDDRSVLSDTHSASDTSVMGADTGDDVLFSSQTVTIELIHPGRVKLELSKTSMPIRSSNDYSATPTIKMSTHTYVIITTIPRSLFVPNKTWSTSSQLKAPSMEDQRRLNLPQIYGADNSPPIKERPTTPSVPKISLLIPPLAHAKAMNLILPTGAMYNPNTLSPNRPSMVEQVSAIQSSREVGLRRPVIFNRDGTVVRQRSDVQDVAQVDGISMDVNVLLETTDWSKTPLGPRDTWPQSLKTIVAMVMQYPHQCCVWWGPDLTLIYNTPYAETMHKHPYLFGMSGPEGWAEIWASLGPLCEIVLQGTPVFREDDFLMFKELPRQGNATYEAFHSWMWVPIMQEDGTFGGLWNATIDTTKKVLLERRLGMTREMSERTSIARTMKEFDTAVLDILTGNPRDAPFVALYHVNLPTKVKGNDIQNQAATQSLKAESKKHTRVHLHLVGSIGVPDNHPSTPAKLSVLLPPPEPKKWRSPVDAASLSHSFNSSPAMSSSSVSTGIDDGDSDDGARLSLDHWPFKEALQSKRVVLVEDCSDLIKGFPVRIWDELPTSAIVIPVNSDSDEGIPSTVLVLGLSIRRPFDDDYESFILASGIAAVRSYEAERKRLEELAGLDRAKLPAETGLALSKRSHELRTPLTLISGPIEDMLQGARPGPERVTLEMIRRNTQRLVSTLMDVSRLEGQRMKGSFRRVDLSQLTRELAVLFNGAMDRAKLKFVIETEPCVREVYVDPEHWEKIVYNLIGNALKYTMKGYVHLSVHYTPTEAIFEVSDSGVGIPASDVPLIGERFHRVNSISRSHEGTGIGLALVKELIKLHGGTMEMESVTAEQSADGSHGSTFRVRLLVGSVHLPRESIDVADETGPKRTTYGDAIVDEALQWSKDKEESSADSTSDSNGVISNGNSEGKSSRGLELSTLYFSKEDVVMLVDDSFDTRRYMRSIFSPFCTVVEARDGQEALDMCKKLIPQLIVSDVMMPNLDGFGLLAALKESKPLRIVPVIMLTARGGDDSTVEGLLAGADAHMQLQLGKRRKYLEAAFEEQTTELRTLAEYSPVGIFRCSQEGNVTFANPAWYEMSGYPAGEQVVDWTPYIDVHCAQRIQTFWDHVRENNEAMHTAEWQFANGRWGDKIIRLDIAVPGLKGILGCVTDITERKLHEETQRLRVVEAEHRRLEAEEAKRQQELLIDITSHEIRNPISSLMQITDTNLISLQEQLQAVLNQQTNFIPTDQLLATINEDLEALESIYQCGLTQERICNDVLSLGRIQLDMFQMFDVETNIRSEANKVISIFQNEARMKRIALSFSIGEQMERLGIDTVKTDPVRLGQVMTNLLSNGIRFTSTSPIRKINMNFDLSLEPPRDDSCLPPPLSNKHQCLVEGMPIYLYIGVTDTGPGLTPAELELLFQRFSQVSPKTHTIYGGSGLGLFVCRKITEIMGGRIEVASEHGKGSTFRFFITVRMCAPPSSKRDSLRVTIHSDGPPTKKRETVPIRQSFTPFRPHVLIVEDNLINQTVLARQLRHVEFTCEVASNGLEALEKIRKVMSVIKPDGQPYDCVIMDIEMPGESSMGLLHSVDAPVMDGLTAVRHVRAEEAAGMLSRSSVVALTGNARQGQIDEARRMGMDDVVIKPYKIDQLLQKIDEVTNSSIPEL